MDLSVSVMSKAATVESILKFQTDNTSIYWRKKLFTIYQFLDGEKYLTTDEAIRKEYLTRQMGDYYDKVAAEIRSKTENFNKYWLTHKEKVVKAFADTFNIDYSYLFNDITAEVSLNPICPRNINKHSFSIFFQNDEQRFLDTAIHEMIHFSWFEIWQKHFHDNCQDYESPHLKWILSEMVIDTFIRYTKVGDLFSNFRRQSAAYKYFYAMTVKNKPILETLSDFYKTNPDITHFMELAYKYCQANEQEIRKQIL